MTDDQSPSGKTEFRIFVLGPMVVTAGDWELDTGKLPRRAGALVRLLASVPDHKRLREEVIDIFWPEATPEAGASNLRSTLQILRQWLGGGDPSPVISERGWIGLNPEFHWEIDLDRFELLTKQVASGALTAGDLNLAATLFRGEPFEEDRYEDWALPVREGIQRRWRDLCLAGAEFERTAGSPERASAWLERQLDADPVDEETLQLLLTTLGQLGHRTEALRTFQRFEKRLEDDLGVPPSPETIQLVEQIRTAKPQSIPPKSAIVGNDAVPTEVLPRIYPISSTPYLGREAQLKRILEHLDAGDGERLILISGEAGMGKTRMLSEVAERAFAFGPDPVVVLFGSSYEQEGRLPYGPIYDALLGYVMAQPAELLSQRFHGLIRDISRIVPEVGERLAGTVDMERYESSGMEGSERLRLFWTVGRGIERIADGRRLLLLLDDLQWADDSTIQMLHFVLRQLDAAVPKPRILIVGAFRPEEVRHGSPLALLNQQRSDHPRSSVDHILLEPLPQEISQQVISPQLGGLVAADSMTKIAHLSHGNPLFAQQIAAFLLEQGRMERSPEGWQLTDGDQVDVPHAVREVVSRRFRDVDQETRETATLAAVLGEEFAYDTIASAGDVTERSLLASLEWGLAADVLSETAVGYRFEHPLLRQVLYETTSEARRVILHRRAGAALEQTYGPEAAHHAAELAFHYARAGSHEAAKAAHYLDLAGDASGNASSWIEALTFYERAIEIIKPSDLATVIHLHEKAGDVLLAMARHDDAREHYLLALGLEDPGIHKVELQRKVAITRERLGQYDLAMEALDAAQSEYARLELVSRRVEAAIELARAEILIRSGRGSEAESTGQKIAVLLADTPSPELGMAHHILGAAALQQGDLDRAKRCHEQSLSVRRQVGDERALAQSWVQLAHVLTLMGSLAHAEDGYRQAFSIFEATGDPEGMASCWSVLGTTASYRGSYAEAEDYLQRCLALREPIGDPLRIADCWNDLALVAARRGALAEAEERLERGRAIGGQTSAQNQAGAWGTLGLVAFAKGEYREAEEWYRKSLSVQQQIGDQYGYSLGLVGLGLVFQCRGDLLGAEALYRQSLEIQQHLGGIPWTGYAICGLGDCAAERGDLELALRLTRQARRLAHQLDLHDLEGMAALAQARVFLKAGRTRAPETLINRASALASDNNATKTSADAALAMAEFRLSQSHFDEARLAAKDALQISTTSSLAREQGLAHTILGRIALAGGHDDEAVDELGAAEQIFSRIGAKLELARVWLWQSKALLGQSDRTNALELAKKSLQVFNEVGASLDAVEAANASDAAAQAARETPVTSDSGPKRVVRSKP